MIRNRVKFHRGIKFGTVDCHSIGSSFVTDALKGVFDESKTRSLFAPIPTPSHKDDWMAQYSESAQSFCDWKNHPLTTPLNGRPLVFLTVGSMENGPDVNLIKEFLSTFLTGVEMICPANVEIQIVDKRHLISLKDFNGVEVAVVQLEKRQGHDDTKDKYIESHVQYPVDMFEHVLNHYKALYNAYGVIAITMADLHMDETDEFSMGAANFGSRTGILSFARYSPRFQQNYVESCRIEDPELLLDVEEQTKLITLRSTTTMIHEILHIFHIRHCVFKDCLMRGSGRIIEEYAISKHLCLVDLHKLIHLLSENMKSVVDVEARFHALAAVYRKMGDAEAADWCCAFVKQSSAQTCTVSCGKRIKEQSLDDDNDAAIINDKKKHKRK